MDDAVFTRFEANLAAMVPPQSMTTAELAATAKARFGDLMSAIGRFSELASKFNVSSVAWLDSTSDLTNRTHSGVILVLEPSGQKNMIMVTMQGTLIRTTDTALSNLLVQRTGHHSVGEAEFIDVLGDYLVELLRS